MIDQHGNKIQPHGKTEPDPKFALAELQFMMKGFYKNQSVPVAMSIAKKLNAVTENNDIFAPIEDDISSILEELETYSAVAGSEDLCWELFKSLRNLRYYNHQLDIIAHCVKYHQRSAMIFNTICELNPTEHNKCCKIIEVSFYAFIKFLFEKNSDSSRVVCLDILLKEEECFKQLAEKSKLYFRAGRNLYKNMYFIYNEEKDSVNRFSSARETAYYAKKMYQLDKSDLNLQQYLIDYVVYAALPEYSYPDNIENFKEAAFLAEDLRQRSDSEKTIQLYIMYTDLYTKFLQA